MLSVSNLHLLSGGYRFISASNPGLLRKPVGICDIFGHFQENQCKSPLAYKEIHIPQTACCPRNTAKGAQHCILCYHSCISANFPRSYPVTHTDTSQLTRDKQGSSDNSLPHFLATVSTVKHPRVSICRTRRWKYLPTERLFLDAVKPNLQSPPSSRRSCIENICTTAVLQGK